MADNAQFGTPKAPQFGDRISSGGGDSRDSGHCAQCEAMLTDALDETLNAADRAVFEAHLALCEPCSGMLADAKRGAAWLEMLRDPRPEPPAALLERILAQTTGIQATGIQGAGTQATGSAAEVHARGQAAEPASIVTPVATPRGTVLPFRTRVAAAVRGNYFGHAMMQPRLAMTAAMAFFSIALTLNLTGVHVTQLRAGDLKPSSIKRDVYSARVRAVQYYEGLRVVYELESRVHDLETDSDDGSGPGSAPAGAAPAAAQPAATPEASPAGQQEPSRQQAPRTSPGTSGGSSPGPGSSRRESLTAPGRMLAVRGELSVREFVVRERGALA